MQIKTAMNYYYTSFRMAKVKSNVTSNTVTWLVWLHRIPLWRITQRHTQTHRHTDTDRDTHRHMQTHRGTHWYTDTHTQIHVDTQTQRHRDTRRHTDLCRHTYRHMQTDTHRHADVHAKTHAYPQTHTGKKTQWLKTESTSKGCILANNTGSMSMDMTLY